jgi:predicted O-methyltransferase YrrM
MLNLKKVYLPKTKRMPEFHELFEKHISGIQGWLSEDEAQFLFQLSSHVERGSRIVEIGSYEGKSTVSLALGSKESVFVEAVDPHEGDISEVQAGKIVDTYERFLGNISKAGIAQKVVVRKTTSLEAAKNYSGAAIGLLFIDGWHSTQAVLDDIDAWLPFLHPEGIVVFDDWNQREVKVAINQRLTVLPKLLGAVGKDLAFTNSQKLQESELGAISKASHKRLVFLGNLISLKSKVLRK